jgi:hypothetical protein
MSSTVHFQKKDKSETKAALEEASVFCCPFSHSFTHMFQDAPKPEKKKLK